MALSCLFSTMKARDIAMNASTSVKTRRLPIRSLYSTVAFGESDELASIKATFGSNLERLLQDRKVRQNELARALGVDESLISRWKKGQSLPEGHHIEMIADFFTVTFADLFRDVESPPKALQDAGLVDLLEELARRSGYELVKKR